MSHTLSGRQWAQTQHRLARQSSKQDSYLDPTLCKPIVLRSISTKSVAMQCPLCQVDPEDRIHFILLCPALSESRDRHLRIIRTVYPEYDILSNHLKVTILLDSIIHVSAYIQSVTEMLFTVSTATARGYTEHCSCIIG